jgi:hypothetical protein
MAVGEKIRTLHITPGPSASASLRRAIREAGRDDEVLSFCDDLSCGPVDPDDPALRAAWWAPLDDLKGIEKDIRAFWDRVEATDDRLVVWYARHASMEHAFFLCWADRLGEHPFDVVDVTGRRFPFIRRDGFAGMSPPTLAVGIMNPDALKSLLGCERPFTAPERQTARQHWRHLKRENAHFRIVTAAGLVSAPAHHFDRLILDQATAEWRTIRRSVGDVMGHDLENYIQVGDTMLLTRIVSLIGEGKLLVDGDQRDIWSCRVRLST